jgi:hypothetical protein
LDRYGYRKLKSPVFLQISTTVAGAMTGGDVISALA